MDPTAQLMRAQTLLDLRREVEARAVLTEVLAADPDNATAHLMMAAAYGDDTALAVVHADRAVALEPENVYTHQVAAFAHSGAKNRRAAIDHARQMIRLAPQLADSHSTLAQVICGQAPRDPRVIEEARRAADRAVDLEPANKIAWHSKALTALLADDRAGAERAVRKALEIDPHMSEAQRLLASLDSRRGRVAPAMSVLQSLVRADPRDERAINALDKLLSDVLSDLLWAGLVIGLTMLYIFAALAGRI